MSSSLRVLVADDEAACRRRIARCLAAVDGVEIVGECADGGAARQAIVGLRPDLVFLDVRMPVLDGFDVVRGLAVEPMPAIVFTTAYEDYAVAAFEISAVDYLLKPVEPERLLASLDRVRRRGVPWAEGLPAPAGARLVLACGATTRVLLPDRILSIQAAGNYVRIRTGDGDRLARESLVALEERLPAGFARVHRSWIVNLRRLADVVRRREGWELRLDDGSRVPVGRSYRGVLADRLDDR